MTAPVRHKTNPSRLPQQARSRARRAAMIEHSVGLFNRCDFDEVTVAEITGELGYSTGSFYSYFTDKAELFIAVQGWVNQELEPRLLAEMSHSEMAKRSPDERLEICVAFALDYFRAHTGLIRNALRYERRIPQGWAPNRATTKRIVEAASHGLSQVEAARLETALQLAFGLLVNAVLHDPGPLRLHDPGLSKSVLEALTPYLSQDQ